MVAGTEFAIGPSGTKHDTVQFLSTEKNAIKDFDIRKILPTVIDHRNEENRKAEISRKQDTFF